MYGQTLSQNLFQLMQKADELKKQLGDEFVAVDTYIADTVDSDQDFKHKFANNHLTAHQTFKTEYEIDVF